MSEADTTGLNYPRDAAAVRDLIREAMAAHRDHDTGADTGGGFGSADLWLWIGGTEYHINVKPVRSRPANPKLESS